MRRRRRRRRGGGGGERGGGGRGDHNYNAVFHNNASELYTWAKGIVHFSPVNEDKEKKEEEQVKEEDNKENGKEITTTIQSFAAIQ